MIAIFDTNGERVTWERIRTIVINNGEWEGRSEVVKNKYRFVYKIHKNIEDSFFVSVSAGTITLFSSELETFNAAMSALNALDHGMMVFYR